MKIGMLLFERFTQLDLTGPYEVFCRMPDTQVFLISKESGPIVSEHGMKFLAEVNLENCPLLDIFFIPGGYGVNELMQDSEVLTFLQKQSQHCQYVTSVCTGSLVLGAAGLLKGKRATTHWLSLPFLEKFLAETSEERFVIDGKIITGGGITAGIDFALEIAALLHSEQVAKDIQLMIEYNPGEGFKAGHPSLADQDTIDRVMHNTSKAQAIRSKIVEHVSKNLP